jgi:hypothetical protein
MKRLLVGLGVMAASAGACVGAESTSSTTDAGGADSSSGMDATQSDVATSSVDGTTDGGSAEGATSTDAAGDSGDGGPPMLSCTTWKWPQPLVLEDLSTSTATSNHKFGNSIVAFPLGTGPIRVIAAKSNSPLFSIYTVTPSTQTVVQLDEPGPGADSIQGIWRDRVTAANETAVVAHVTSDSQFGYYEVFAIPDSMGATGTVPNPFGLFSPTATDGVTSMTVAPFTTTDIFEAVSVSSGSPATYTLGVGRVSPTSNPTTLGAAATAVTQNQFAAPKLYRANGNVYIYDSNDSTTPGVTGWAVPETAVVPDGGVTPQIVSTVQGSVYDIAPASSGSGANILVNEVAETGNVTNSYKLRLGVVPNANAGSWVSTDLPYVASFAGGNLKEVPYFSGHQLFWGDDIMLVGPGYCIVQSDGGCITYPGLNVLWLNAQTGVRAEEVGANKLFSDTTGFFDVYTLPAGISATSANWNVIWGQHMTSDAGLDYDVLYMNVLQCELPSASDAGDP